jgi:hypothetical protein
MIDIVSVADDLGFFDTETTRAANILSVQLGALEYAPDLGVDLQYFMSPEFEFQNETFRAYLLERLTNSGISVGRVDQIVESLYSKYTFNLPGSRDGGGLIAG